MKNKDLTDYSVYQSYFETNETMGRIVKQTFLKAFPRDYKIAACKDVPLQRVSNLEVLHKQYPRISKPFICRGRRGWYSFCSIGPC